MTDLTPAIEVLHRAYCRLSDMSGLPLTMPRHYAWESWMAQGWGLPELTLVIAHVKKKILAGQKWSSAVNFYRIVIDTEAFSMELAEAQAASRRIRVPTGLRQALHASGRPAEPKTPPPRSAAQIMRDAEAFKKLKAMLSDPTSPGI